MLNSLHVIHTLVPTVLVLCWFIRGSINWHSAE